MLELEEMTVVYTSEVATVTWLGFIKLLIRSVPHQALHRLLVNPVTISISKDGFDQIFSLLKCCIEVVRRKNNFRL